MHTNHKHKSAQQQLIGQRVRDTDANVFFNLLTSDRWLDTVESLLPAHRERLFPPTETLSMFMAQALNADSSCQQAVDTVAVKRLASGVPPCSTHTSAYCRARMRLPADMVSTLALTVGQSIAADAPSSWHWRNRPVRLVDGTTVTLPDTDANQATYPQPLNQKPGLGFPLCRIVGLVCLGSGAVLNAAFSRYAGKGNDELSLLRTLLDTLARGDVLIGDALYATYFLLCQLQTRGVDAVFEQHGARRLTTDFRCGRRLGTRDHLIALRKPARRPSWMAQSDYDAAPDEITVRELRVGGKTLVTTLLCAKETDKAALKWLYQRRWHVELDLRNIKTTLKMERLSCQTPAMVVKEIWVYLLAYNLIRLMMADAARHAGVLPRQISFKHTVQLWIAWQARGQHISEVEAYEGLLTLIAERRVGNRADRIEPRTLKRRAKSYSLLTVPRHKARAKVAKHGHPKKA